MHNTQPDKGAHDARRLLGMPRWLVVLVPIVALAVGACFSVTVLDSKAGAGAAAADGGFDATVFAKTAYDKTVVPYITKNAIDLATLTGKLKSDKSGTEESLGHNSGTGSQYAFAVKTAGVAGAISNGLMQLTVPGVADGYQVYVQVGPAVNGSALRDVSGKLGFDKFPNQIAYQNGALALNERAKKTVLSKIDPTSLSGKTVSVTGAFVESVNPGFVALVPIELKAQG